MQVGKFALEFDQRMIGAGNIAGAAGARSHARRGLDHGADHLRVLTHAHVVVGAPDHDIARAIRRMPDGMRKAAGEAFKIGEYPVAALVPQFRDSALKKRIVFHEFSPIPAAVQCH